MAQTQAALFGNMATTFGALAGVAPFLQEFISEGPPTLDVGIREFPRQRPFLRNSAAFFRELRPGVRTLPASAPVLADAFAVRHPDAAAHARAQPPAGQPVRRAGRVLRGPGGAARRRGRIASTMRSLRPLVAFLTPVQTRCNYVTLLARNAASLFSEGDSNGTYQRFIVVAAPLGRTARRARRAARPAATRARRTTSTSTRTRTPPRRASRPSARPATRTTWSGAPRSATCRATRGS